MESTLRKGVIPALASYTEKLSNALAEAGAEVYIVRIPRFGRKYPAIYTNVVGSIPDDADVVHTQMEYGLYQGVETAFLDMLKRLEKPKVATMHAVGMPVDPVIAEASDILITHNKFCKRVLRHKSVVIPHGCEPMEAMPRDEAKKKLGIHPAEAPVVGYCGFVNPGKSLETLVEAMRTVKEAGLLIGGGWHTMQGTDYIMRLKRQSLSILPGRCQWLGYVEDENLSKVYGAMDLVVYPSRWITESGALLMALGHGKAVITRRLKPTVEKEKQGALWTFRTVRELRRKIRMLLRDEGLRGGLEEGAMEYAERNSWDKIAEMHLSLYEDVAKHAGG